MCIKAARLKSKYGNLAGAARAGRLWCISRWPEQLISGPPPAAPLTGESNSPRGSGARGRGLEGAEGSPARRVKEMLKDTIKLICLFPSEAAAVFLTSVSHPLASFPFSFCAPVAAKALARLHLAERNESAL